MIEKFWKREDPPLREKQAMMGADTHRSANPASNENSASRNAFAKPSCFRSVLISIISTSLFQGYQHNPTLSSKVTDLAALRSATPRASCSRRGPR
jgi:hypothetical protein